MKLLAIRWIVGASITWAACVTGMAAASTRTADAIWANGVLYGVIATDTSFKSPPVQSTDVLLNFANSGLSGQRSVSEAAPGDADYNGGRWRVMAVTFTAAGKAALDANNDGVIDAELVDAETVLSYAQAGWLTIEDTGVRFVCPLLPRK